MSMKSLMSAAHAAGYAMAAEDVSEPRPVVLATPPPEAMRKRASTALMVLPTSPTAALMNRTQLIRRMHRSLVRYWVREWMAHAARRGAPA